MVPPAVIPVANPPNGADPVDLVILSNGPGELVAWVKPVLRALRQQLGADRALVRISVVLSPCPNASGGEADLARSYEEADRVQSAEHFWPFLLRGKTQDKWDWRPRGVVIFLGGDQVFPLIIGRHLGYRTVLYAEWDARWPGWVDRYAVMSSQIAAKAKPALAHKFTVVGDLMVDRQRPVPSDSASDVLSEQPDIIPLIGLMPGSKAAKLTQGVPLMLAIADHIQAARPQTQFVVPVAPTLTLTELAKFADPATNPLVERMGGALAKLVEPVDRVPYLVTAGGVKVRLEQADRGVPSYDLLSQLTLCITTVGANTAELGSLAVPMVILLPTQQLDAMRAWNGIPGLLANLPGVGKLAALLINWYMLKHLGFTAWPNIWAQREIVPELVGRLEASAVAAQIVDYLDHPAKLASMRTALRQARGEAGAAMKLAAIVVEELAKMS
jgi:hypothetical protein